VLHAAGGLVMPGLADATRILSTADFSSAWVNLRDAATPQEFVRRIKEYAAHLKPGEWVLGGDWDHTLWRALPCRTTNGSIRSHRIITVYLYRVDGHMALANACRDARARSRTPPRDPVGAKSPAMLVATDRDLFQRQPGNANRSGYPPPLPSSKTPR